MGDHVFELKIAVIAVLCIFSGILLSETTSYNAHEYIECTKNIEWCEKEKPRLYNIYLEAQLE